MVTNSLADELRIGSVTLPNRLVSAPMERNYCDTDGHMTEQYEQYLLERSRAGVGLVFTEATYVRQDGKGRTHQLGAHDDSCIAPLAHLVDLLHAEGSLVGCEVNHGGRTVQSRSSNMQPVAPSPIPCEVAGGEMPRELTTAECYDLVTAYADAAERCVRAGVDVISIHSGHGYLVHQFMSPLYNLRSDEFADPALFLSLVMTEIRERIGGTPLGIRISAVEGAAGGLDADQTFAIVERLPLDTIDFLDVSAGSYEAGEWIVQSGEWEPGYLREIAQRYRALGKPMGLAGRINSPDAARMIIDGGFADFVSLARALHADPLFATAALHGGDYRPCIACNVCIDNLGSGQVGCSVNPDVGRGRVPLPLPSVRPGSTVSVLGAGPAGLTAARDLAIAGASVTLVDRTPEDGGGMALASRMRSTPDFARFLDWSARELDRLGVQRSVGDHTGSPDAILIATGGSPAHPLLPGIESPRVSDIRDWLAAYLDGRLAEVPSAVTIWGADGVGMSAADTLATAGIAVVLIGAQTQIAPESGRRSKILAVPRLVADPAVDIHLGVEVLEIRESSVLVRDGDGTERELAAPGALLVSQGVEPSVHPSDGAVVAAACPADGSPSTIRFAVLQGHDAATELAGRLAE